MLLLNAVRTQLCLNLGIGSPGIHFKPIYSFLGIIKWEAGGGGLNQTD